eukprot:gene16559-22788_t
MEEGPSSSGASGLLANLPSKGVFVQHNTTAKGRMASYVCTHDTQAPKDQVIATDQSTAALIRVLQKKDAARVETAKGKRPAGADAEAGGAKKKMAIAPKLTSALNAGASAPASGSGANASSKAKFEMMSQDQLKKMTNKELQELCKSRGMVGSGKKEELLRRLLDHQRKIKRASQPS